jgi:hypothetical protein
MAWGCGIRSVLFFLLLLHSSISFSQSGKSAKPSAVEKYRNKMQSDPTNGAVWALCLGAAEARTTHTKAEFAFYAKRVVSSIKALMDDPAKCPCADVLGLYWKTEEEPANEDKFVPEKEETKPVVTKSTKTTKSPNTKTTTAKDQPVKSPPVAVSKPSSTGINAKFRFHPYTSSHDVGVKIAALPDFIAGTSVLVHSEFRSTNQGVYVVFIPDPMRGAMTTKIHKHFAGDWYKSTQKALVKSMWPVNSLNEKGENMNYTWTGLPQSDLSKEELLRRAKRGEYIPEDFVKRPTLDRYSNNIPAGPYKDPPANLLKITRDRGEKTSALWALGNSAGLDGNMDMANVMDTWLYREDGVKNKEQGDKFTAMNIAKYVSEEEEVFLEASVRPEDTHVWIGSGNTLVKASPDGNSFTLKTFTVDAAISKIRVTNDYVWVLAGQTIYRVDRENNLTKYYTINSGSPSFAADDNNLYTNDGFIIYGSNIRPLLGTGPSGNSVTAYKEMKNALPGLQLEVAPGNSVLYGLDIATGRLYYFDIR